MTATPIHWATFAGSAAAPMGLQHYELQILQSLRRLAPPDWEFHPRTVGSIRQTPAPDVRLPAGIVQRGGLRTARMAGRFAYRGVALVHRFDLRLPPFRGPEVVTVHDLPPLRFSDEGALPRWAAHAAREARLIICPSNFAANEVRTLLGAERVVVIPNGVGSTFRSAEPFESVDLKSLGIDGPFVLHVGGASRRKNLPALAEAWKLLTDQLPDTSLVSVGPASPGRSEAFRCVSRVILPGYLPPEKVARLMATALAVVVPSTYEGFGLPCIEAMATGTPVVAANVGALPEVCGDAAVMCDPTAEALAAGILRVLHDAAVSKELIERGRQRASAFTWQRSAEAHIRAYDMAFR